MDLQGKRVLVVGMASSGIAIALFLRRHGARVVVSEMRAAEDLRAEISGLLEAGVAIETGGHRERTFLDADFIVVSPGVPSQLPLLQRARAQQIPVLGEIEVATRFLKGSIVAITGSNGKTTTTALVGHILAGCGFPVQVGGNIGVPLSSLVETSTDDTVNVMELSSFQLETVQDFHAHIAVVLNLTQDHLDRHGSMEAYAAAKQRIFLNQTAQDYAVLNGRDEWCRRYAGNVSSSVRWFNPEDGGALAEGAFAEAGNIVWREARRVTQLFALDDIPLRGRHNLENVLAAVSVACLLSRKATGEALSPARVRQIADAVRSFKAVEHRLEFVAKVNGVNYFNDSKATNVDSTLRALESFSGGVWVILGGKDKGSDYRPLIPLLRERTRGILLIGAAAAKIASHLEPSGLPLTSAGTLSRALEMAHAQAKPGDTVLLAPACASFDQFQNYEHRGRVFKELVARLAV